MAVVAERAFTSRSTLQKVEAGNANVSIGIYAAVCRHLAYSMVWVRSPISRATALAKLWPARSCRNASASSAHRARPMMADIEVHINIDGRTRPVGLVRSSKM
jgi:hypothetical protein